MTSKRTLHLRAERLEELTTEELAVVAGGALQLTSNGCTPLILTIPVRGCVRTLDCANTTGCGPSGPTA